MKHNPSDNRQGSLLRRLQNIGLDCMQKRYQDYDVITSVSVQD